MPESRAEIESFVSPAEFLAVVLDVEKYPEFLPEVKKVEVHSRTDTAMKATFHIAVAFAGFKVETRYTLDYRIDGTTVRWTLAESPDMTKNEGEWVLEDADGETKAHYRSEMVTTLPIPLDVQQAFAEAEMPKLMEKFRDRAED